MDKTTSFENSKRFFSMFYRALITRHLWKQKRDEKIPEIGEVSSLNILKF